MNIFITSTKVRLQILVLVLIGLLFPFVALATGGKKGNSKKVRSEIHEFDEKYFADRSVSADPEIERYRAKAQNSVNDVDDMNHYVDYLSPSDLNKLPIGLKKKVGNSTVKIAISSAVFTARYAELTVFAKVDIPQNNTSNVGSNASSSGSMKSIYFGISGLKLSKDGGIIGDARLVLLGDYAIPMNGGKSVLILKGGINLNTGQAEQKTYINIDCNGFKELGLAADIEFPRSLLIPVDSSGVQLPTGNVKGSFSTVVSNWNDIVATIENIPSFEIKGVKGITFNIQNAVVDLSDLRNSPTIVYPTGYQQKYIGNDETSLRLWRGVYAKNFTVTLPKSFKDRTSTNRVSFGVNDMIIDNNGISGLFKGLNVLPIDKGSAGGWQFSVDSFQVAIEANRLLKAGFGGQISLPVNKNAPSAAELAAMTQAQKDSVAKLGKYLGYSALMGADGNYLCRVLLKDSVQFDVWKANVLLEPNSYIDLAASTQGFKPSAYLNGSMNFSSKTSTSGVERVTKILDFKGVSFKGLKLSTEAPRFTAEYFGYNGSIKLGILPVSIDSINLRTFGADELGVGFTLKVNLQDNSFSGTTKLYVIGKYSEQEGLQKWQYNRLKIDSINLSASIGGAVKINGMIAFLDDDPVYGDGFKGRIAMSMKKPEFSAEATAIFGNKGFRYWFVDAAVELPVPDVTPSIAIKGFGGGAYYRMKKVFSETAQTPSNMNYIPDSTAGLGVRASVSFFAANKKLDDGEATLEIAFNKNGGVRYIGLFGYAKIMATMSVGSGVIDKLKSAYANAENFALNQIGATAEQLDQMKVFQPTAAAKKMFPSKIGEFNTDMRAVLGISYDFNNNVFHSTFDLYVNSAGNVISGIGADGRAGWAVMHIDSSKWYIHMGTPYDPLGVKLALGPVTLQTQSYFMLGHDLPAFPPLPSALQTIMAQNNIQYQSNIDIESKTKIQEGRGIAFGANVSLSTGDIRLLILYAKFDAGMGFDVMLKDYSGYQCAETGQTPGIGGWYAQGRVYAYLQGEAGVRIKIGPIKKNIAIIKGATVALLEARMPKPSWIGGFLAINTQLLGGLVKVNANLKISFGDKCTLTAPNTPASDQVDFNDFKVVTSVTPGNNTQNVGLNVRPVVNCSTPLEKQIILPEGEGSSAETIRAHLTSISLTGGTNPPSLSWTIAEDGNSVTIQPNGPFEALTDYVLKIKVNYQRIVSGNWANMTDSGQVAEEITTVNFKSSNYPPFIADDNIGAMYPYKEQKYFYRNESTTGRVLLVNQQNQLFSSCTAWKARFINATTNQLVASSDAVYNGTLRSVTYAIPSQLQASTNYRLEIKGAGTYSGTIITDTSKPILQFNFSTSKYGTIAEKMNAMQLQQAVVGRIESDVIDLQAKVSTYEGFDMVELVGSPFTGNKPLIYAEADLTDESFYNSKILPLNNYPNFYSTYGISVSRPLDEFGAIPTRAITLSSYYITAVNGSTYSSIVHDRLPFVYSLNKVYNEDFIELRNKIVNKYLSTMQNAPTTPMYIFQVVSPYQPKVKVMAPEWVAYFNSLGYAYDQDGAPGSIANIPLPAMVKIVTQPYPFMNTGSYKVKFKERRALSWNGTSGFNMEEGAQGTFIFQNPIQ